MNFAEIFIRRPVMTTLLMVGILFAGVMGYRLLPVNDLPLVDFPTVEVRANLSGASPETMASAVATPLEKQFSTIAGLDAMSSMSSLGSTSITLQFALDRDIDAAAQDVQSAIAKTLYQLPRDLITPSYRKVNPADSPILNVVLTSATMPLYTLTEYGENLIAQRLSMIQGVAQVQVYGSQKYAVRIQLDPRALSSRGISIDEVTRAVQQGNVNLPTGTLWGDDRTFTIQAEGQLADAGGFRRLVVAYEKGAPVRLGELGQVLDSVQNDKIAAWYRDSRAIMLAIQRQPGSNTVAVAQAVRRELEEIRRQLPAAVDLKVMFDRAEPIRESVDDVKLTLVIAFVLVVLVIFLFLRSLRATAIPAAVLPMSLIGTFAIMYLLGFSLDNLSLMAMTLAVGFVVDDAIVMLENIVRHLEMGKKPLQAALDGSREIGFTILSMTLSLAAVFIPLIFMGGIVGRLFTEFAMTIVVAVLISGAISLSLSPMMCSRLLRPHAEEARHGRIYLATERAFDGLLRAYQRSLAWVVRHKRSTVVFSLCILVGTYGLFRVVPMGFLPSEDYSFLSGFTEAVEGISFQVMVKHQQEAARILLEDPNVEGFVSSVGAGGPNPYINQGRLSIRLKPREKRELSADQVVSSLRVKLSRIPGIRVYLQNPPTIRLGTRSTKSLYQFSLQGSDTKELFPAALELTARMQKLPGLLDVNSDLLLKNPQVNVAIDRDRASLLGVSAEAVQDALYSAYGSRQISTIYTATNQYWIILELLPEFQREPSALNQLYVRGSGGALVPLSSFATLTIGVGPLNINHAGQLPAVTISFNLREGTSIGQAVPQIERLAQEVLPPTLQTSFAGTAQAFKDSEGGLGMLLFAALVVIYLVLGILYESYVHPLTILTGLPFAGFGALATLLLFRTELNLFGIVGLIMLMGIVKKNAIMMIDFALERQRLSKLAPEAAILEACGVRFRPIMMTTLSALVATLPIALGLGAGAASRRPLGLVVVGGLLFSQLITLYVTPVFYVYFDALGRWFGRRRAVVPVDAEQG